MSHQSRENFNWIAGYMAKLFLLTILGRLRIIPKVIQDDITQILINTTDE